MGRRNDEHQFGLYVPATSGTDLPANAGGGIATRRCCAAMMLRRYDAAPR
jgi:hypothetical protein